MDELSARFEQYEVQIRGDRSQKATDVAREVAAKETAVAENPTPEEVIAG
jgi:hypothetical protein